MTTTYLKIIKETLFFGLVFALVPALFEVIQGEAILWPTVWFNLGVGLISGFLMAITTTRAETYIERKNARWKAKRQGK